MSATNFIRHIRTSLKNIRKERRSCAQEKKTVVRRERTLYKKAQPSLTPYMILLKGLSESGRKCLRSARMIKLPCRTDDGYLRLMWNDVHRTFRVPCLLFARDDFEWDVKPSSMNQSLREINNSTSLITL